MNLVFSEEQFRLREPHLFDLPQELSRLDDLRRVIRQGEAEEVFQPRLKPHRVDVDSLRADCVEQHRGPRRIAALVSSRLLVAELRLHGQERPAAPRQRSADTLQSDEDRLNRPQRAAHVRVQLPVQAVGVGGEHDLL